MLFRVVKLSVLSYQSFLGSTGEDMRFCEKNDIYSPGLLFHMHEKTMSMMISEIALTRCRS